MLQGAQLAEQAGASDTMIAGALLHDIGKVPTRRVDHDKVNRRALEAMVKSGAMDDFGQSRRALMHQVPEALKSAEQHARAQAAGSSARRMLGEARSGF